MQKKTIFLLGLATILSCYCVFAQTKSGSSVTYNYYSEEEDNPTWLKDIITAGGENYSVLYDRQGVLATKQNTVALDIAVSNTIAVAAAYQTGFESGIANLSEATNNIPTSGFTMGLVLPLVPSQTRTAIEGFIVDQEYDVTNNTDILTIHFTQDLSVQPIITCPYITDGGMTTNHIKGAFRDTNYAGSNWTNVYTVVLDEVTYDNCHVLYVKRPISLLNYTAAFGSVVRWGSDDGIDYSTIVHTAYGQELYSGTLTNYLDHTYVVIEDGAILEPGFISYDTSE